MPDQPEDDDWSDVDSQTDSDAFTAYLEAASAEEQVQRYKRRSHEMLHPEPGDRILDAGCGLGHDVAMLADRVAPGGEVVGLDNSWEMIERAIDSAGDLPGVSFHTGAIGDIEYPDDDFDASRTDRVLQHLDDPETAIGELTRVTKPGGRVGLTDTAWESLLIDAPGAEPPHRFLEVAHQDATNPEMGRQLYRYAREAGLTDLSIDPILFHGTSFSELRELTRLDPWLDRMVAADLVSTGEVEGWLDRLRRADEADRFFASVAAFTVVGTVPR